MQPCAEFATDIHTRSFLSGPISRDMPEEEEEEAAVVLHAEEVPHAALAVLRAGEEGKCCRVLPF